MDAVLILFIVGVFITLIGVVLYLLSVIDKLQTKLKSESCPRYKEMCDNAMAGWQRSLKNEKAAIDALTAFKKELEVISLKQTTKNS